MVKYAYSCSVGKKELFGTPVVAIDRDLFRPEFYPERLEIAFKRTIRVPDNGKVNQLPPSLGTFALHKVQDYAERLPPEVVRKGGVFLSMHQKEAMWIRFEANAPFLIKIYVGGVNAISGEHASEKDEDGTKQRRADLKQRGCSIQDYVVVPDQKWIDGVAVKPGLVRQFVAMPMGEGYSVEAQLTGREIVGGLQLEITPAKVEPMRQPGYGAWPRCTPSTTFHVVIKIWDTGETFPVFCAANDRVGSLKVEIEYKDGIPNQEYRHVFAGKQLEDERTLADYNIVSGSVVLRVRRLRGAGEDDYREMKLSLAPGGLIKQHIREDKRDPSEWLKNLVIPISVHILNSADYRRVTGKNPPPSPVDAQTYAKAGLPFFDFFEEEESDVAGTDAFAPLKSVNDMQRARGELQAEDPAVQPRTVKLSSLGKYVWADGDVIATADPDGLMDPAGPRRAFRTLADLEGEVRVLALRPKKA